MEAGSECIGLGAVEGSTVTAPVNVSHMGLPVPGAAQGRQTDNGRASGRADPEVETICADDMEDYACKARSFEAWS